MEARKLLDALLNVGRLGLNIQIMAKTDLFHDPNLQNKNTFLFYKINPKIARADLRKF